MGGRVGVLEGLNVGNWEGSDVGIKVGLEVGAGVGDTEGTPVGEKVGRLVVGDAVGLEGI